MKTYIYTLSANDNVFYVGKTNNPKRRYSEHLSESKRRRGNAVKKEQYIRQLLRRGVEIVMTVVEIVTTAVKEVEQFYIETFNVKFDLVNTELM